MKKCIYINESMVDWEYEKELNHEWDKLTYSQQQDTIKYLKLMKRFGKDESSLSLPFKKWLLENCELPTHLVPIEILNKGLML